MKCFFDTTETTVAMKSHLQSLRQIAWLSNHLIVQLDDENERRAIAIRLEAELARWTDETFSTMH